MLGSGAGDGGVPVWPVTGLVAIMNFPIVKSQYASIRVCTYAAGTRSHHIIEGCLVRDDVTLTLTAVASVTFLHSSFEIVVVETRSRVADAEFSENAISTIFVSFSPVADQLLINERFASTYTVLLVLTTVKIDNGEGGDSEDDRFRNHCDRKCRK